MYKNTIDAITELLFMESDIDKVDLIFIFGNDWLDTMYHIKELYNKDISKYILISGHSVNKDRNESEAMRFMKKGVEIGIPKDMFLLEENATNTKENLILSKKIIENKIGFNNINSILFVCKTFHTRRVLMTAQKHFPKDIKYSFYPVNDERNIQKDNWWKDEISKNRVIAEIGRIAEYTLKDDLSIF
jgi:uncharacterized SAM-binding protein YcdF (DUF218 family)